jgi:citrate lyase gamma subunit
MAMPPSFLDTLLDGPFELTSRPEPVPGDLRLAWGIALVILILGRSRARRASLQKLHFMAHSARTKESREEVNRVFAGDLSPGDLVVRVEPWLNRAVAFATAASLVTLEHGRSVKLTDDGIKTLERILSVESVMTEERAFLDAISPRATEAAVERVMRMERLL